MRRASCVDASLWVGAGQEGLAGQIVGEKANPLFTQASSAMAHGSTLTLPGELGMTTFYCL